MLIRLSTFFVLTVISALALASDETAWVVTSVEKPVQCISPISVYTIDGQLVRKNAMGFALEPGTHSLVGTASTFSANCPQMKGGGAVDVAPLEYEFEAGKTYYIGLEHKSSNPQNWKFVVWRVK